MCVGVGRVSDAASVVKNFIMVSSLRGHQLFFYLEMLLYRQKGQDDERFSARYIKFFMRIDK